MGLEAQNGGRMGWKQLNYWGLLVTNLAPDSVNGPVSRESR